MKNLVPLSNTDARWLRIVSLGTGVKNGTTSIQNILKYAREVMDDTTFKFLDKGNSMEVEDFEFLATHIALHWDDIWRKIEQAEGHEGLPVTAQSYRAVKAEAISCLVSCYKLRTNIETASRCRWIPHAENHNENDIEDNEQSEHKKADPYENILVPEEHPALPPLPHINKGEQ